MKLKTTQAEEFIFQKLSWIERRRFRIVESVASHFGKSKVAKAEIPAALIPSDTYPKLNDLVDHRPVADFLEEFAITVLGAEAITIKKLVDEISPFPEHVKEQILFGARTSGQEAGRSLLNQRRNKSGAVYSSSSLSDPTEIMTSAIDLLFFGFPWKSDYFVILRNQGPTSIHFNRSPFLPIWHKCQADPRYMSEVHQQWIRGVLDVIGPGFKYGQSKSLELGDKYGLAQIYSSEAHAGP